MVWVLRLDLASSFFSRADDDFSLARTTAAVVAVGGDCVGFVVVVEVVVCVFVFFFVWWCLVLSVCVVVFMGVETRAMIGRVVGGKRAANAKSSLLFLCVFELCGWKKCRYIYVEYVFYILNRYKLM